MWSARVSWTMMNSWNRTWSIWWAGSWNWSWCSGFSAECRTWRTWSRYSTLSLTSSYPTISSIMASWYWRMCRISRRCSSTSRSNWNSRLGYCSKMTTTSTRVRWSANWRWWISWKWRWGRGSYRSISICRMSRWWSFISKLSRSRNMCWIMQS